MFACYPLQHCHAILQFFFDFKLLYMSHHREQSLLPGGFRYFCCLFMLFVHRTCFSLSMAKMLFEFSGSARGEVFVSGTHITPLACGFCFHSVRYVRSGI